MMKYIIAVLILGAIAGYLNGISGNPIIKVVFSEILFDFSLIFLIFVMGVIIGVDREIVGKLRKTGIKILAFPAAIVAGSIFGGFLGGILLGINIYAAMGVCAGVGWYTLTGPLASQLFGVKWGAIGFTVNFLREILTIISAPITTKIDKYAPIAIGGATAMDTTLPIITRFCGQDSIIIALTSGFILTLIAPFTITAIAMLTS
ncbi:MAG: lysine exporter LysO family protein [Candidatus Bathyarchaeia archaeon]|nr:lysine exporter LysO family protein [Candidatus Bathyarchaeota archaeon]